MRLIHAIFFLLVVTRIVLVRFVILVFLVQPGQDGCGADASDQRSNRRIHAFSTILGLCAAEANQRGSYRSAKSPGLLSVRAGHRLLRRSVVLVVVEGLDTQSSYAVLERNAAKALRGYRTDDELRLLLGTGVSAAAVWHMREQLDRHGFEKVKIVASSGFGPDKCRVFSLASAPVDVIGTGSFLPQVWSQTYATADIVSYDGQPRVKAGREFLIRK